MSLLTEHIATQTKWTSIHNDLFEWLFLVENVWTLNVISLIYIVDAVAGDKFQ